jgi:hypothetical protein
MPGPKKRSPQPHVQHCPVCKGPLKNVPSLQYPVPLSHNYECGSCRMSFEINDMT